MERFRSFLDFSLAGVAGASLLLGALAVFPNAAYAQPGPTWPTCTGSLEDAGCNETTSGVQCDAQGHTCKTRLGPPYCVCE